MSIYDQVNVWDKDDEFRIEKITAGDPKAICDLGCGTGRLTVFMTKAGRNVWGIDPDAEAIAQAHKKDEKGKITWIIGTSEQMRGLAFDRISMTANVAQEIVTDEEWLKTLQDSYDALNNGGQLIFDCRNPNARAWERWTKEHTLTPICLDDGTAALFWYQILDYSSGLATCTAYIEANDMIISEETFLLRFRSLDDVTDQVLRSGFKSFIVYGDWEDKPADENSKEFLFVATK